MRFTWKVLSHKTCMACFALCSAGHFCVCRPVLCNSRSAKTRDRPKHSGDEPGASTDPEIYCQWIKLEIDSDKSTYKVGEPIEIKYKIKNATKNLTLQPYV